jgi:hypothetical protein
MELKFIIVNFYSAFFKRDIIFEPRHIEVDIELKKSDASTRRVVEKIERSLMAELLTEKEEEAMERFDK